jgi:hypothetical protein
MQLPALNTCFDYNWLAEKLRARLTLTIHVSHHRTDFSNMNSNRSFLD